MNSTYFYFIVFFCILYLTLTEESILKGIYLLSQYLQIQYEKIKWWILYNPRNPIVKHLIWRRSLKLAKKLQEEFDEKNKTS